MAPARPPLYVRILIAVGLGVALGILLGPRAARLGELGLLIIRLLKALAAPLILFAIIDSFLRTHIPARRGLQLLGISAVNAAVATGLGLLVANVLQTGARWRASADPAVLHKLVGGAHGSSEHPAASLDPLKNLAGYLPETLVEPFAKNNIITVVLLAVVIGAALRHLKTREGAERAEALDGPPPYATLEAGVRGLLGLFALLLEWLVKLVPLAVLGVVASVTGKAGLSVLNALLVFVATIVLGLGLHVFVYYGLLLRVFGGLSPRRFFAGALDAILMALSSGSSLATLPVTLRCLTERLGVSPASARLAACVGTNLNHDGIILYEAGAALFVAQAFGVPLTLGQQGAVALAAVMAGVGIAGIPDAGLITLPLVLAAAGIPEPVVAVAVPLLLPVDWLIGRCRAATNVISDMTVAQLLDRLAQRDQSPMPEGNAREVQELAGGDRGHAQ